MLVFEQVLAQQWSRSSKILGSAPSNNTHSNLAILLNIFSAVYCSIPKLKLHTANLCLTNREAWCFYCDDHAHSKVCGDTVSLHCDVPDSSMTAREQRVRISKPRWQFAYTLRKRSSYDSIHLLEVFSVIWSQRHPGNCRQITNCACSLFPGSLLTSSFGLWHGTSLFAYFQLAPRVVLYIIAVWSQPWLISERSPATYSWNYLSLSHISRNCWLKTWTAPWQPPTSSSDRAFLPHSWKSGSSDPTLMGCWKLNKINLNQ